MNGVEVRPAELSEIESLRAQYRSGASCQIVRDSILPRGLADPYLVTVDGAVAAYGGIWNEHFPGRIMEFHVDGERRDDAPALFRAVVRATAATHVEAQTNMPRMAAILEEHATDVRVEHLLFVDGPVTGLGCPGAVFRRRRDGDGGPEGDWVVERDGSVIAAGGVLLHYNPPYGDVYMAVAEQVRRQGIGSYLVQELRRVCREAGGVPAARCDPDNEASLRTLLRGGFERCGRLLAGRVGG